MWENLPSFALQMLEKGHERHKSRVSIGHATHLCHVLLQLRMLELNVGKGRQFHEHHYRYHVRSNFCKETACSCNGASTCMRAGYAL